LVEYPRISASCGRRTIGLFLAPLLKSDNYRRPKEARGFGIGGRQRQRAYYDALRDLATPATGVPHSSGSTPQIAIPPTPSFDTAIGCALPWVCR
jgi:hypothetical protein